MKAVWNGTIIAESDITEIVEGNHYFPPESVHAQFLTSSDHKSTCPWKGVASYYDVNVDGETNAAAAWYYPNPNSQAARIQGYVAFWKGVEVQP